MVANWFDRISNRLLVVFLSAIIALTPAIPLSVIPATPAHADISGPPCVLGGAVTGNCSSNTLSNVINVAQAPYNAVADCSTDNFTAFQGAINAALAASQPTTVYIPDAPPGSCWRIGHALRLGNSTQPGPISIVTQSPNTTIKCTGDGAQPDFQGYTNLNTYPAHTCFMAGYQYTTSPLPTYTITAPTAGATTLSLSTTGKYADFAVGDIISVESAVSQSFTVGSASYSAPWWLQVNRVMAINSGSNSLTLLYPMEQQPWNVSVPTVAVTGTGLNYLSLQDLTKVIPGATVSGTNIPAGTTQQNITAWSNSEAVTAGELNVNGPFVYYCDTSGTTSSSGSGPNTQTTSTNSITDGTAHWHYVGLTLQVLALSQTTTGSVSSGASITLTSTAQITRMTNIAGTASWPHAATATNLDTGIPAWATWGASIQGGIWETSNSGTLGANVFSPMSGMLDARIDVHEIIAAGAFGGNRLAHSYFHADHALVATTGIEPALGSHDNIFDIGSMDASTVNGTGDSAFPRYVGADEGSRDNQIHVGRINIGGAGGADLIQIVNASGTKVVVDVATGGALDGDTVSIVPGSYSLPTAINNDVVLSSSRLIGQSRMIVVGGANGSHAGSLNNRVSGRFQGNVSGSQGFYVEAGAGANNLIYDSVGENGVPVCDLGIGPGNELRNIWLPTDMATTATGQGTTIPQLFQGCTLKNVRSPTVDNLISYNRLVAPPLDATSSGGLAIFIPGTNLLIPAGTLLPGDEATWDVDGVKTGNSGTVPSSSCNGPGTGLSFTLPAGSAQYSFHIHCSIKIIGNTTEVATGWESDNSGSQIGTFTQQFASSNITTTGLGASFLIGVTSGSDVVALENVKFCIYRPTYDSTRKSCV